uniref:(northern house mosquito) hypothetical protein n=1 Tax=Culex pipiens TaxID=7175 RepID=A0A8D8G0T1_CULPI
MLSYMLRICLLLGPVVMVVLPAGVLIRLALECFIIRSVFRYYASAGVRPNRCPYCPPPAWSHSRVALRGHGTFCILPPPPLARVLPNTQPAPASQSELGAAASMTAQTTGTVKNPRGAPSRDQDALAPIAKFASAKTKTPKEPSKGKSEAVHQHPAAGGRICCYGAPADDGQGEGKLQGLRLRPVRGGNQCFRGHDPEERDRN